MLIEGPCLTSCAVSGDHTALNVVDILHSLSDPPSSQPNLLWSTFAVIIACVVVAHSVLACVFVRSKRLAAARAKLWFVAVMILGPFAWLLWWFRYRAVNRLQTPASSLNQSLIAERHASAPPQTSTRHQQ